MRSWLADIGRYRADIARYRPDIWLISPNIGRYRPISAQYRADIRPISIDIGRYPPMSADIGPTSGRYRPVSADIRRYRPISANQLRNPSLYPPLPLFVYQRRNLKKTLTMEVWRLGDSCGSVVHSLNSLSERVLSHSIKRIMTFADGFGPIVRFQHMIALDWKKGI